MIAKDTQIKEREIGLNMQVLNLLKTENTLLPVNFLLQYGAGIFNGLRQRFIVKTG